LPEKSTKLSGLKFSTRLSLLFGGLLAISLITILISIDQIASKSAQKGIEDAIHSATTATIELIQDRTIRIQQSVRLLAGDHRFRVAYATGDEPTISAELDHHKNRIPGIDLVILSNLEGTVISNTYSKSLTGQTLPWPTILNLANKSSTGEATAFFTLNEDIYHLAITPLDVSGTSSWLISGFRVDIELANKLSNITGSDITFFYNSNAAATFITSTLSPDASTSLLDIVRRSESSDDLFQYQTKQEARIGHFLPLNYSESIQVTAFVGRSLDEALAPYRKLSQYVLWIFAVGILLFLGIVVRISRYVTQSISDLSDAAEAVAKGYLDTRVLVARNDEIGKLSTTFNEMVKGLSDKEKMHDLLGKVVSPKIANKLLEDGVKLGGEVREVSVLFCDIHGFTSLSEVHSASETVRALNIFFSEVSAIIESHNGIIDKYIGDAVMAIFSAPLEDPKHAENAVKCGIAISRCRDKINASLPPEMNIEYRYGIGVHSGKVVAGNIGSANRLNYTVIGDTVNVASRVESLTRLFNTPLVVTKATVQRCSNIEFTMLDTVQLKGRKDPVSLYAATELLPTDKLPARI
jgi:adenylate cyclase